MKKTNKPQKTIMYITGIFGVFLITAAVVAAFVMIMTIVHEEDFPIDPWLGIWISVTAFVASIVLIVISVQLGKRIEKAKREWWDSRPVTEKRATLKSRSERVGAGLELVFEAEDNTVHTYLVTGNVYNSVIQGDVGVLVLKDDGEKLHFHEFKREGQGAEARGNTTAKDCCPGCGAAITSTKLSARRACEFCGRVF